MSDAPSDEADQSLASKPAAAGADPAPLTIVHEGRAGFIAIDTCRYPIEHIEGGRFCIHFPAGQRHRDRAAHLLALQTLAQDQSHTWHIDDRSRTRPVKA